MASALALQCSINWNLYFHSSHHLHSIGKTILHHQQFVESLAELSELIHPVAGVDGYIFPVICPISRIITLSSSFYVSFQSLVKMNSTNWPAPNVWVFIAQLVEHCSPNTEAMGLNPVEVRDFFFGLICSCLNCNNHCDNHTLINN